MDAASDPKGSAPVERYGVVARLFHWVVVLMVAIMLPVGIAMTSYGFEEIRDELFILHKGTGAVLLVVVLARLVWRVVAGAPDPPPHWSQLQRRLVALTHGTLYILLLTMTVTGYVRTVGGGFPIELLEALGIPPLIPEIGDTAETVAVVHKFTAYALTGLVGVHVARVFHDQWVEKKEALKRMWPPIGG